jgi:hypothetical protein
MFCCVSILEYMEYGKSTIVRQNTTKQLLGLGFQNLIYPKTLFKIAPNPSLNDP